MYGMQSGSAPGASWANASWAEASWSDASWAGSMPQHQNGMAHGMAHGMQMTEHQALRVQRGIGRAVRSGAVEADDAGGGRTVHV